MNWKEYENKVLEYFQARFPDARIYKNVEMNGRLSKIQREIDILIESQLFGHSILIAIECKNWNSKLDVADVGTFIDKLKDVGISKGVMISKLGYSAGAHQRARSELEVQLQVLDFENMPDFYGFWGNPYRGNFGAVISAPNGWVVNSRIPADLRSSMLCFIHPFEFSVEKAMKNKQFMYFQIFPIVGEDDLHKTLYDQDEIVLKKDKKAKITYWEEQIGKEREGTIQYRQINYHKDKYTEFTGGVETDEFFAYCVYSVVNDFVPDDLARLKYVMSELFLIKIAGIDPTDSHKDWQRLFGLQKEDEAETPSS
jgi:Restriction endonuclease